jgi:hypothetical protein
MFVRLNSPLCILHLFIVTSLSNPNILVITFIFVFFLRRKLQHRHICDDGTDNDLLQQIARPIVVAHVYTAFQKIHCAVGDCTRISFPTG